MRGPIAPNEASFIQIFTNEACYYSTDTKLRHGTVQIHQKKHATVQMFLMRHSVIHNHLMRHDTV
jgi:hypothetical protein